MILCSSDSADLEEEGLSDLTGFWASHDFWLNYFITLQVVESWVSGTILFQRQSKAFCEAELQAVPALEEDAPGIALCARALHLLHMQVSVRAARRVCLPSRCPWERFSSHWSPRQLLSRVISLAHVYFIIGRESRFYVSLIVLDPVNPPVGAR